MEEARQHSVVAMIKKLNFVQRAFLWSSIKPFGELQFLTRASYLFLFIVPVLAGLWPIVTKHFFPSSVMPLSWVVAFFAAQFVMFGQTAYQMFAPDLIQNFSRQDYIDSEVRRFSEHGMPGQFDEAERVIEYVTGHPPNTADEHFGFQSVSADSVKGYYKEIIQKAAGYYFDEFATYSASARYFSGSMYFAALLLLFWLLGKQGVAVLSAAGIVFIN